MFERRGRCVHGGADDESDREEENLDGDNQEAGTGRLRLLIF